MACLSRAHDPPGAPTDPITHKVLPRVGIGRDIAGIKINRSRATAI